MKAKFIYESLDSVLKPKSREDIRSEFPDEWLELYDKARDTYDLEKMGPKDSYDPYITQVDRKPGTYVFQFRKYGKVFQVFSNKTLGLFPMSAFDESRYSGGKGMFARDFEELKDNVESYRNNKVSEGIGDKYAEKTWGIPVEDPEFEKQYNAFRLKKFGNVIGSVKGFPLVKNPKNLDLFPPSCRGMILKNGDLLLVPDVGTITHVDIVEETNRLRLTSSNTTKWQYTDMLEPTQFICVQRVWNKDGFGISESYVIPKRKHGEERAKVMELFEPFINKARTVSPQYSFINDVANALVKHMLTPEELKKYVI